MPKKVKKSHFLLNFNRNVSRISRTLPFFKRAAVFSCETTAPATARVGVNGATARSAAAETESLEPAAELMLA